ncbi:DENN domain-containing protein 5B isoform X2 [Patella vulgata]|uniref:DENN domain-containing protein 5B isoform X2 n=1 Tax=Patella vulgata TaxID=6465 RepID=UPI00218008D1|nr:DENN domain-containing protein 5B isoform X2 [Patella vulgata]
MTLSNTANRFADYFVVCGLDVSSGLEPDRLAGESHHCEPLSRPYKSKVLAHFPETVSWNPFDQEAVGMLCLPKGLQFRTQRDSRNPKFHSFIITKEDGSRICGAAYVFYEEVTNKQICAAMQTLHAMHQAEHSPTLKPGFPQIYTPDSPILMKKIPTSHEKSRVFDKNKDKLYVTKCICLILQMPFVKACKQFLKQLHEAVNKPSKACLPFESYIYNVLYEVPLPPPGRSLKFYGVISPIFCQRPSMGELPLFDFSLWELFKLLGVDNLLSLFVSVLMEHQVLLYSSDYQKLMLIAEGINCLIFPFAWQHVYVPILPASLQHFLDAPVPFIMGLHRCNDDRPELPSEANMCFVDVDNNSVEYPEDLPGFPHQLELKEELLQMLNQYQELFSHNININITSKIKSNSIPNSPLKGPANKNITTTDNSGTGSYPNSPKRMEILQQSETWKKISSLAKKTGVWESIEDFAGEERNVEKEKSLLEEKTKETCKDSDDRMPVSEVNDLKFNSAIREIFMNRFVHMFNSYESFVIQPSQDLESWISNRDTMQNFDKASFLSDQPEGHLPFLSPFIETQMFATLVDNKIVSQWEEADPYLNVFEARIRNLSDTSGEPRTPTYSSCTTITDTEVFPEKRATFIDHTATKPQPLPTELYQQTDITPGFFPSLNKEILNTEIIANKSKTRENAKWRRKDRVLQHAEHLQLNSDQRERYIQEARSKNRQPKLSEMSAAGMVQTNWKFVETLLKECKTKTKKMLVVKMGREAVELGHGELSITGVEENTLIASLCDLLERIWSHGLQTKKGKSALWSHLLSYQEIDECTESGRTIDPSKLTPGLVKRHSLLDMGSLLEGSITILGRSFSLTNLSNVGLDDRPTAAAPVKTHRRRSSQGRIELPALQIMPSSVIHDMRKVQKMSDIRTDVGYARAWVRLALEKKVLSSHLKELLSDTDLLRSLYKRYAFLRCEDEREQFLYHLLSLNAVDFFCFTNTFMNTMVAYKVLIFPSTKFGCATTTANPWICVAGQLGETGVVEVPRGCLEFNVEHKNLGILTTLRIGHDNSGMSSKWLVEYVLVRNEVTGHTYRFTCGRWLGKGVDDGSIERLLVAELLPHTKESEAESSGHHTPPRNRSPTMPRRNQEQGPVSIPTIQEMLGHSVNNLVKHFYKPEKERGNLTFLLCGDRGLVNCMEMVFQFGFRSSRFFRNKMFIWDYLEKVKIYFENTLSGATRRPLTEVGRAGYWLFCNLLNKINNATESIGKDGKFQIFVCVGVRDRCLQKWLPLMANTPVTGQMYEANSFLRDPRLTVFLVHIIETLNEFNIVLESSVLQGLDI